MAEPERRGPRFVCFFFAGVFHLIKKTLMFFSGFIPAVFFSLQNVEPPQRDRYIIYSRSFGWFWKKGSQFGRMDKKLRSWFWSTLVFERTTPPSTFPMVPNGSKHLGKHGLLVLMVFEKRKRDEKGLLALS